MSSSLREVGSVSRFHLKMMLNSFRSPLTRTFSFSTHILGSELPNPATGWHMRT
ncbi:MAG: hypothetical protein ACK56F_08865 [bacterium]